jgi:predicted esterase
MTTPNETSLPLPSLHSLPRNLEELYCSNVLPLSQEVYQLEVDNVMFYETDKFTIQKYVVDGRSYLVKMKKNLIKPHTKCIMFFHGSRDLHWDCAILSTDMLSDDYMVVYLQGNNQGISEIVAPHIHKVYGYISYGENFFEIRDYANNFTKDIEYVKNVKYDVISRYNLNKNEFYAVGHSNGGVFVCLFPVYLPEEFKAIVSHQGGMGWDEWFNIPFEKLNDENIKPYMYFFTGEHDIHKEPCI